jgi:two-component system, chemotaxis family, sensor kinase CheA
MSVDALKNEFLIESFENLSSINKQLTTLEKKTNDKELINSIYRTVHTLKGSAGFLGYEKLGELTHNTENLLDMVREGQMKVTPGLVDVLLGVFDICYEILKSIDTNDSEGGRDIEPLSKKLGSLINSQENGVDPFAENATEPKIEISAAALESMMEQVEAGVLDASALDEFEVVDQDDTSAPTKLEAAKTFQESTIAISNAALDSIREQVEAGTIDQSVLDDFEKELAGDIEDVSVEVEMTKVDLVAPSVVDKVDAPVVKLVAQASNKEDNPQESGSLLEVKSSIADSFVRVNVEVLDRIMNIVGELVLNRNQLVQHASGSNNSEFTRLSQQLNVITSELQSEVMSTRMQPVGSVLTKFERLVRDFSRSTGKSIQLKLSGQETELDKTLLEAIKDPLVHIVRNSCDHGLESADERAKASKPAIGTIEIKAYNESGQVTLEIKDDGQGLDKARILDKAIEKGLIPAEQAQTLSDQQIFTLIFNPGFTTADKVTNISGRGVGMDVVKTNIEKIGGSVSVNSNMGEGTTFKLRIPLTLAIVPALVIRSKSEYFAIPQQNLVELVRVEEDEVGRIQNIQGTEFLKLRGKLTPIFRINKLLDLESVHAKSKELLSVVDSRLSIASSESEDNKYMKDTSGINVVILNADNRCFGIVVDEIMDTEEIVVKPLINQLNNIGVFGGATIMGDGRVSLILDALGFLSHFTGVRDKKLDDFTEMKEDKHDETEYQESLLFKLADDRVYAVPLSLVSRLEEFDRSKVEKTGNQSIIRYLDSPMPLIDVENTLKLSGESILRNKESEKVPVIVASIRKKNFGICVKEIMDISIDRNSIDSSAVDRKGIIGTIFIDDKTVSLLDLFEIIGSQGLGLDRNQNNDNKGKTILLIDDSVMYRKLEGDALIEEGYEVILANDGAAGFEVLEKNAHKVDLIVTDIEMPVLDGFEFAVKVRADKKYDKTKIIALSTRVSDKDFTKGRESGFDYHIEKFRRDEVMDLVEDIFNK